MYKLKRMIVWLRRMRHSRGFGVQSPSDYRFVRYVVNEHWPYYAYDELKKKARDVDQQTQKLCRLYFRMANWLQPQVVVDYRPATSAYALYMHAGCHKVRVTSDVDGTVQLCRMSIDGDYENFFLQVVAHADNHTVLIVEGIKRNREAKAFWEQVKQDERTGVTFDLYYCGIVFFNKLRYKQHYIVNF